MTSNLYSVIYESAISPTREPFESTKTFRAYTAKDAVYQCKLYFRHLASREGYVTFQFKILYVCPYGTYKAPLMDGNIHVG